MDERESETNLDQSGMRQCFHAQSMLHDEERSDHIGLK